VQMRKPLNLVVEPASARLSFKLLGVVRPPTPPTGARTVP
jgi:hypothetical protein